MDDHGITVAELDGRMDWLPGDTGAPSAGEFVGAAASLGARAITVLGATGQVRPYYWNGTSWQE